MLCKYQWPSYVNFNDCIMIVIVCLYIVISTYDNDDCLASVLVLFTHCIDHLDSNTEIKQNESFFYAILLFMKTHWLDAIIETLCFHFLNDLQVSECDNYIYGEKPLPQPTMWLPAREEIENNCNYNCNFSIKKATNQVNQSVLCLFCNIEPIVWENFMLTELYHRCFMESEGFQLCEENIILQSKYCMKTFHQINQRGINPHQQLSLANDYYFQLLIENAGDLLCTMRRSYVLLHSYIPFFEEHMRKTIRIYRTWIVWIVNHMDNYENAALSVDTSLAKCLFNFGYWTLINIDLKSKSNYDKLVKYCQQYVVPFIGINNIVHMIFQHTARANDESYSGHFEKAVQNAS